MSRILMSQVLLPNGADLCVWPLRVPNIIVYWNFVSTTELSKDICALVTFINLILRSIKGNFLKCTM